MHWEKRQKEHIGIGIKTPTTMKIEIHLTQAQCRRLMHLQGRNKKKEELLCWLLFLLFFLLKFLGIVYAFIIKLNLC